MKLLIAGDFCPRYRVAEAFARGEYATVLSGVKDIIGKADYSIVNFECPVQTGDVKPIEKQGPNLKCSLNGVEALKYAGFKCVTLANNHFLDFGKDGVAETISSLDSLGIDHVGGGVNLQQASAILYKEIKGKCIAIINCCEHEFSIATETSAGSNPLNPVQQYYAIKEARKNADKVLVIVHGGHEHWQLPSPRMVETYRFFIDAGADAVVNHHQHCYTGYEVYQGKPIFYGIGNFCFDLTTQHTGKWTEGYMVTIDFSADSPSFTLQPYRQCADKAVVELLPADAFSKSLANMNDIISNPVTLKAYTDKYYSESTDQFRRIFEPTQNRFVLGAIHRGWIPSLINRQRLLSAYNYVFCESHRDKLMHWLQAK